MIENYTKLIVKLKMQFHSNYRFVFKIQILHKYKATN